MQPNLTNLKKLVFYEMLEIAGRVFIIVRYSERVRIGTRGFTEDEKKNGIVLVFNKAMNFSWDDSGITAVLVFGPSQQKCFVPAEDIIMIYSPELNSQFISAQPAVTGAADKEKQQPQPSEGLSATRDSNVVSVDFKKKKDKKASKTPLKAGD